MGKKSIAEYTPIPDDILESMIRCKLSGSQHAIILFVLRKTFGWKKNSDEISISAFAENLNLTRVAVVKSLNALVERKILLRLSVGRHLFKSNEWAVNKNIEEWNSTNQQKNTSV